MGLDITAYRQLIAVPSIIQTSDNWNKFAWIDSDWSEENFPGRAEGITNGAYSFMEHFDFRAGSYSGYNNWRDWLAKQAGFGCQENVWDNHTSGPFWELIKFADNEGVIGPVVAKKLAADFAAYESCVTGAEWQLAKYRDWKKAFEMAADGGAVVFH